MIDISLAGLVGAIIGTILAAATYGTVIDAIERWLMARRAPGEHPGDEVALLRRGVLAGIRYPAVCRRRLLDRPGVRRLTAMQRHPRVRRAGGRAA